MVENAASPSMISGALVRSDTPERSVKHTCGVSVIPVLTVATVWIYLMDMNVRMFA